MKFTLETDFNKHLNSPELLRVYLLYGSQPYLIALYGKKLAAKALEGKRDAFNFHAFTQSNFTLQGFYDAVESLPLMGESRCVTVDLEPDKLSAEEMKEFCSILSDPPDTTTVIVSVQAQPAKKEKLNALIKACDKSGGVMELGARSRTDTLRFLRNYAQKNGCELSSEVASYLMERCGDDLQLLTVETDKLCAFAGSGTLSKEQVDEISCAVLQAKVFDLSKAILRGNLQKAMETTETLLDMRENEGKILSVLSGAFVDLYRGFAVRKAGESPAQAAVALGYAKNREFALKNGMTDSSHYSASQLGRMLNVLAEADMRLKSTGTDSRALLEQTIVQLSIETQAV